LGLDPEHIPDLIRLATHEELVWANDDHVDIWAPIHAWRALGQLRAEAAIEPLFSLFIGVDESDWVTELMPEVFGMIGPAALPKLKAAIADIATDEMVCIDAIACVEKIGTRWPEARSACVALLMEQLEQFAVNDSEANGFLVSALVKLQAREAAPLIEQAFAARCVDRMIIGGWKDVQARLGLKSAEEASKSRRERHPRLLVSSPADESTVPQMPSKIKDEPTAGHKKAKSKMAKQSRKKNRKR